MSHLRLLPAPPEAMTADEECLGAFQQELAYIFRTLRRLGVAASEVEDLAQEVFLALRSAWDKYDRARPLRPYLFGIAFRVASVHQRKRKREAAYRIAGVSDSGPGPDDSLQSKQARALVLTALEGVPLPRRAVLIMHDIDDVAVGQVAAALDVPLFTVYSRLRKARREFEAAVRRMLKEADVR